ncbi:MAG: hypothetical protein AAFS11_08040, partial [Planctomycetota bacterium]
VARSPSPPFVHKIVIRDVDTAHGYHVRTIFATRFSLNWPGDLHEPDPTAKSEPSGSARRNATVLRSVPSWVDKPRADGTVGVYTSSIAWGFPFRCMATQSEYDYSTRSNPFRSTWIFQLPSWISQGHFVLLPLAPILSGWFGNALFWSALTFMALFLPGMAHSRRRTQRGLCPACGYDLAGVTDRPCPECGAKPWKSKPKLATCS